MAEKQCSKCGQVKAVEAFPLRTLRNGQRGPRGQCSECYLGDFRAKRKAGHYKVDLEKQRARTRRSKDAWRARNKARTGRSSGDWWDRMPNHAWRAEKSGREYWGKTLDSDMRAWKARQKPVRTRRGSKPWHGLSDADAYRVRYQLDPVFAKRERERQQMKRHVNPIYALQWARDGNRWYRAAASSDGSVTFELLKQLRDEKWCAYCGSPLDRRSREIDHVQPLAQGGTHTADNLVASCKPCNRKKGRKPFLRWLMEHGELFSIAA